MKNRIKTSEKKNVNGGFVYYFSITALFVAAIVAIVKIIFIFTSSSPDKPKEDIPPIPTEDLDICGEIAFDSSIKKCVNETLCNLNQDACGSTCYEPSNNTCVAGKICNNDMIYTKNNATLCCDNNQISINNECVPRCNENEQLVSVNGNKSCCSKSKVYKNKDGIDSCCINETNVDNNGKKVCCADGLTFNKERNQCEIKCGNSFCINGVEDCKKDTIIEGKKEDVCMAKSCFWLDTEYNPNNLNLAEITNVRDPNIQKIKQLTVYNDAKQNKYFFNPNTTSLSKKTSTVLNNETKTNDSGLVSKCNINDCRSKIYQQNSLNSKFENNTCSAELSADTDTTFKNQKEILKNTCPFSETFDGYGRCFKDSSNNLTGQFCDPKQYAINYNNNALCFNNWKVDRSSPQRPKCVPEYDNKITTVGNTLQKCSDSITKPKCCKDFDPLTGICNSCCSTLFEKSQTTTCSGSWGSGGISCSSKQSDLCTPIKSIDFFTDIKIEKQLKKDIDYFPNARNEKFLVVYVALNDKNIEIDDWVGEVNVGNKNGQSFGKSFFAMGDESSDYFYYDEYIKIYGEEAGVSKNGWFYPYYQTYRNGALNFAYIENYFPNETNCSFYAYDKGHLQEGGFDYECKYDISCRTNCAPTKISFQLRKNGNYFGYFMIGDTSRKEYSSDFLPKSNENKNTTTASLNSDFKWFKYFPSGGGHPAVLFLCCHNNMDYTD